VRCLPERSGLDSLAVSEASDQSSRDKPRASEVWHLFAGLFAERGEPQDKIDALERGAFIVEVQEEIEALPENGQ
jgi:hypothetical protein